MNVFAAFSKSAPGPASAGEDAPPVCFLGVSSVKLWGMTPAERVLKVLRRHGIHRIISEDDLPGLHGTVILVRADAVIDAPLASVLAADVGLVLIGDDLGHERPVAAHVVAEHAVAAAQVLTEGGRLPVYLRIKARRPSELGQNFRKSLRKREAPYALVVSRANLREVEWRMFMGTYKGATDFITKFVWPVPAYHVTRWLAPTSVTPNLVTGVSAVFVVLATVLFWYGLWLPGLIAAWMMTFLDTVDGKLARVTLSSSRWGDVFDHGIDLVHPPFWYAAWAVGLMSQGGGLADEWIWWSFAAIMAGYVVQRLMEGTAIKFLGLEIHIWRPIDYAFRHITARRNPNLVLLTAGALAGQPGWAFVAVAVWTVVCLVLHAIQLAQAFVARHRRGLLVSWLDVAPDG